MSIFNSCNYIKVKESNSYILNYVGYFVHCTNKK